MKGATLLVTAVPALALGLASVVSLPKKLIYNASASAPPGLYWLDGQPIERGDYVLVQAPIRVRALVAERGYLLSEVPLIKRVMGVEGDEICREATRLSINGKTVAEARMRDGSGRPMPVWQGCRVLAGDRVFLLQDHPDSFDGRYFGPVDRRLIMGRATRLRLPLRKREQNRSSEERMDRLYLRRKGASVQRRGQWNDGSITRKDGSGKGSEKAYRAEDVGCPIRRAR